MHVLSKIQFGARTMPSSGYANLILVKFVANATSVSGFLDATSPFYKRVRPSVNPSVCRPTHPFVGPSIMLS